ncbi:hypothetical protein [Georgenia faecalis]|uniref:DUF2550 family protein n=1 Tax=Georgenia faecalis TaxID=2483799 RepID=A0ABV9D9K7_9MICO|nr:hypothetical protein [Georgenia faecalis]
MSNGTQLVLLLLVIGVPAVLIARSTRKVRAPQQRAERLRTWARLRGWAYRGEDPGLVGRWQVAPFTEPDRWVEDALVGEHRGRSAASFRLETGAGPRTAVTHVLTLALHRPVPAVQLATAQGPVASDPELRACLEQEDAAGMAVRAVGGELVGWVAGEPLLGALLPRLDVLADVAELLER